MRIKLSFVLPTLFLLGCIAVSEQQSESSVPQAPPKEMAVDTKETDAVFPHIKPVYRAGNLGWIEAYCRQRGVERLENGRIRLFIQPMGIVSEVIEIDLTNNQLTVYPGTHSDKEIIQTLLNEEHIAKIKALVTSPEFRQIPEENQKIGRDGASYLVEAYIDDSYMWKLHWHPDNQEFISAVHQIREIAGENVIEHKEATR